MFANLLDIPVKVMTLGALAHNTLNGSMISEIAAMMQRENWTCHVCDTRLPGMMEVDHLKGHTPSGKNAIAPICQVCHDLKHPLWAASRGRLTVIHAPDLDYSAISRITWALVAHHGRPGFQINRRRLARDFNGRREDACDAMGHDNLTSIFEAILTIAKNNKNPEILREKLEKRDLHLRIVPTLMVDETVDIEIWSKGGFKPPSENWKETALQDQTFDYEALGRAGKAIMAKL